MKRLTYQRILIGIFLPIFVFGAIIINEDIGNISGSGGTKSGEVFPVIAQSFNLNISEPLESKRTVNVTVPVESITTEKWMRDIHMRMSVFDKSYPNVVFKAVTENELEPGNVTLDGELTINGIQKPKSVSLELKEIHGSLEAAGSFEISLDNYGIKSPGMGPMKVSDKVSINFKFSVPPDGSI